MPKCSNCGKDYESFLGLQLVDSVTGNIKYFCSSKCRKNALMKRKKRKWNIPKLEKK